MKTKSQFIAVLVSGMFWLLVPVSPAPAASPAELLEKGIYAEETQGEVQAAARIYQEIVNDPAADRSLVAQAQLRLGLCELKLGNKSRAVSALDRLREEFPDQDSLQAIVEQHMPRVLDEIVSLIGRNYIQEVDRKELIQTAMRAMVGRLDSGHAFFRTNDLEFLTTNELKQINEQLDQKLAGVGAVLFADGTNIIVRSPIPGSPAQAGGLRAGDRIVTVNGTAAPTKIEPVVRLLRGEAGTSIKVGIRRGDEPVQEFTLVRDVIRLPSVTGDRRGPDDAWNFLLSGDEKIGYIRLSQVGRQSAGEMQAALDSLKAAGMKALILDERDNPGGWLDGAVAIADLFVESGRILTVKGRKGESTYDAKPEGTFTGFPMAILVNRRTASAAEIVASCLQDHHRAIVVGERTYGEGIVRSLFSLESGVGAVKLPIAAYYRPSGRPMNRAPGAPETEEWGVTPDPGFEVTVADEDMKKLMEQRLIRAGTAPARAGVEDVPDLQMEKALEWIRQRLKAPAQ